MKTSKFLSIALTLLGANAVSLEAKADNTLLVENLTAAPGDQFVMSVLMNNTDDVTAFSFDMYLPEGISVAMNDKGKHDITLTERAEDQTVTSNYKDGYYSVATLSISSAKYYGNSGAICNIKFDIDKDIDLGEYKIEIKNIELTNPNNQIYKPGDISCILTVSDNGPTYDKGYAVEIAPFELNDENGVTADVILIVSETANPIMTLRGEISFENKEFDNFGLYEINYEQSVGRGNNLSFSQDKLEFTLILTNKSWVTAGSKKKLATLNLYPSSIDGSFTLTSGIYKVTVKNLFVEVEDKKLTMAPYSADIYVGNPKAPVTDGEVVYSGDYSSEGSLDLLTASLPDDFTALNLTGVTAIPEGTTLTPKNPNALIKTSADLGLANVNNVVIGKECKSLLLTDGHSFGSPWAFTADNASYVRTLGGTNWGTLYLPFAVESSADVKYYILESATTTAEGVMKFTEQNRVEANTPCVFYVGDGNFSLNDLNVNVPKSKDFFTDGTGSVEWTMSGTLSPVVKDVSKGDDLGKNLYYIRDNKFWKATGKLTINPFRAFFETTSSANASYRIVTDEEGIESIEADMNLESGRLYDLNGREVKNMQKGEIYLLNGMKVMFQ